MTKKLLIIALATMASGIVIAGDDAYSVLDADKNGSISKTEAAALPGLTEQFAYLDTDVNDELSVEEFARFEASEVPASETASELEPVSSPEPEL